MSFERWHYAFDLAGVTTPVSYPGCANRHAQRKRYFFDPLVRLCGGSLQGKRVLDLGCNAGFWSLAAVEAGCDYVRGVDGRAMHVAQANLVFGVKGIPRERYDFVEGDVFEAPFGEGFGVALCLGLLYHVNRPVQLLERIARANTDLLVIDTAIVPGDAAALYIVADDAEDARMAIRSEPVFIPTAPAVIELVRAYGYHGVMLQPSFDDYTAAEDYREGRRRAFVCAKHSPLDGFEGVVEAAFAPANA